ncbi:aminoglycoside 6-adenylyltransferase [Clostridium puniceum]|uniref:aminoglycoside 6-adenylyltransferase n=1 Tax=Clostridium puniceum TaxID=29367 RepID=UPI003BFA6BBF
MYLYTTTDYEQMWEVLFKLGKFIRRIGTEVAKNLGYTYPMQENVNVTEYIRKIKIYSKM